MKIPIERRGMPRFRLRGGQGEKSVLEELLRNPNVREEIRQNFHLIPEGIKRYIDQSHEDWFRIHQASKAGATSKEPVPSPTSSSNSTFEQRLRGWATRLSGKSDAKTERNRSAEEEILREEMLGSETMEGEKRNFEDVMLNEYLCGVDVDEIFMEKNSSDLSAYSKVQSLVEDIDFVGNVSSHYTFPL
eukprot:598357-Hanusia_phi.AAC.2